MSWYSRDANPDVAAASKTSAGVAGPSSPCARPDSPAPSRRPPRLVSSSPSGSPPSSSPATACSGVWPPSGGRPSSPCRVGSPSSPPAQILGRALGPFPGFFLGLLAARLAQGVGGAVERSLLLRLLGALLAGLPFTRARIPALLLGLSALALAIIAGRVLTGRALLGFPLAIPTGRLLGLTGLLVGSLGGLLALLGRYAFGVRAALLVGLAGGDGLALLGRAAAVGVGPLLLLGLGAFAGLGRTRLFGVGAACCC